MMSGACRSELQCSEQQPCGGQLCDSMDSFFQFARAYLHAYFPGGHSFWQNDRIHFSPTNKNGCDIRTSKLF